MKTLLNKEIRLLLPAWIAAMLLAIAPAWIIQPFFPHEHMVDQIPPPLFIMLGMLLLGIASFGQEFNYRTFPLLLSQPVPRSRLWWAKITALAITFISLVCVAIISWNLFVLAYPAYLSHYSETYSGLWLYVLIFLGGGLWTTLLLRQATGAFWFTLVAPALIYFVLGLLAGFFNLSDKATTIAGYSVFIIYSVAGFFWAKRLFFNAQDTDWSGGHVFFQWRKKDAEQTASSFALPYQDRFLILIWKEIKLHEVNLLIAVVLLVITLASLPLPRFVSNPSTKMTIEFAWSLWLLMPLLIGCAAVAEERRLGVLESQHCLPVSRRAQFLIKFSIGLILSVLLGALMPTLIERTRNFGVTDWRDWWIFYTAPAIFFVSFYASTFARATLQAIGLALAIPVTIGATLGALFLLIFHRNWEALRMGEGDTLIGPAACMLRLAVPVSLLVFTGLMFWNFKWLHETWKLIRRNVVVILIGFAVAYALANAIYPRPWELLTPIESPYGPARLTPEKPGQVIISYNYAYAVLPDGRLWDEYVYYNGWNGWWGQAYPILRTERFLHGTNWVSASMNNNSFLLGIKSDGSLWCIQPDDHFKTTHLGSDTDWRSVAGAGNAFLLLKKDRSLWVWGTNRDNTYDQQIKSDLAELPTCLSDKTNWSGFFSLFPRWNLVENTGGELWTWRDEWRGTNYFSNFVQSTNLDGQWLGYSIWGGFAAGVETNGQLWFFYGRTTNRDQAGLPFYPDKVQLVSSSKWKAVSFSGSGSLLLLRDDGTLWNWKFFNMPFIADWRQFKPAPFQPVQLGHYSDWIALITGDWTSTALAADGSLWNWDEPSDHVWLAPSRKPVYMGNIFESSSSPSPF